MPTSPPPNAAGCVDSSITTGLFDIHPDILEAHILTRLDGPSLASAASASSHLRRLSSGHCLWTAVCHSTFPSTAASSRLRRLVSAFPGGPRSFFSSAFCYPTTAAGASPPPAEELISAVDIHYNNTLIFSKAQETETGSGWFRCSPFRVDLVHPRDVVPTALPPDVSCEDLYENLILNWVLIDPTRPGAVNLSSYRPVNAKSHWLSGEVKVRFASVLDGGETPAPEPVQCDILVTLGGSEGAEMQVREVSLQLKDIEGMHLTGKDSLLILQRAMEGKRGTKAREEEGRRTYREFLEMKRERRERKQRLEGTWDTLCVVSGVTLFAAFWMFILYN
ncbi:hypothetical protein NMG60_11008540 [Bertholletia excelsa]